MLHNVTESTASWEGAARRLMRVKATEKKTLDLTQGTIWKVLAAFILPIIAGSLIQQLYTTVDAVIVGRFVGKAGLAAVDSVGTLFKFPINFLNGMSAGATIIVSRFFGQKNDDALDCTIHTAYTIALILGILCSLAGVVFAPLLLQLMAVPPDIYEITLTYVRIYFAGLWTVTLYNMISGVIRAFGDSRSPLYILILCCIINVLADFLLVGALHLGVAGAAIATIAAQAISALLAMWILSRKHSHCHSHIWEIKFCPEHTGMMLRLGLPLAFQAILFPIANSIVQANVNTMGTDQIAAWAVCAKLDLIIWLIADAMSPALSTYVAQNLGANQKHRVSQGVIIGAASSLVVIGFVSALLFFFAGPLGDLFVSKADAAILRPYVVRYMTMMAPFYIFYALAEAFSGACCGLGDTVGPMITTLICTCGLRVAAILFVLPHWRSMETIVWIYIASWIVTGISFTVMFLSKQARIKEK